VIPEGLKGSSPVFFVLCGAVVATHSDRNAKIQGSGRRVAMFSSHYPIACIWLTLTQSTT
jgi:hypothetical protein